MPSDPIASPVDRRQADLVGVTSAKTYLFVAVALTVFMVLVSLVIILVNPDLLDLPQVRRLGYFLALIIAALFGGAGINIVNVLNGHTATMLRLVGEKEHAIGKIEGLKENPNTNIT